MGCISPTANNMRCLVEYLSIWFSHFKSVSFWGWVPQVFERVSKSQAHLDSTMSQYCFCNSYFNFTHLSSLNTLYNHQFLCITLYNLVFSLSQSPVTGFSYPKRIFPHLTSHIEYGRILISNEHIRVKIGSDRYQPSSRKVILYF